MRLRGRSSLYIAELKLNCGELSNSLTRARRVVKIKIEIEGLKFQSGLCDIGWFKISDGTVNRKCVLMANTIAQN